MADKQSQGDALVSSEFSRGALATAAGRAPPPVLVCRRHRLVLYPTHPWYGRSADVEVKQPNLANQQHYTEVGCST